MEDKESGSLRDKSALDILLGLHHGLVTGSLKLEQVPLRKAVYFRDGQILFAASNDPKDQLASILVEEGKLRPEQMEVAQARATRENPLAKVLTELGYISPRELAEAARAKVEKILTDLYTWKDGTYHFVTSTLPQGALVDIELSTPRLLFTSIRRIQDRAWILDRLGSLDTVVRPSARFDGFMMEAKPEEAASEVLALADGVKTVKQIGAASSLGEFEVCKVLAAGLVCSALEKRSDTRAIEGARAHASEEAGSAVTEQSIIPPVGNETLQLEPSFLPSSSVPAEIDSTNAFRLGDQSDLDETMLVDTSKPELETLPNLGGPTRASELLVDELPEPNEVIPKRTPPRPRRAGGRTARDRSSTLQWVVALVLVVGAAFSLYSFVWPLIGARNEPPTSNPAGERQARASAPVPNAAPKSAPPVGRTETPTDSAPSSADPRRPEAKAPSVAPPAAAPKATATPATAPPPAATPPAAQTAKPSPGPPNRGRALLETGDISGAGRAFLDELTTSATKFTIAVGLYCNEENVSRISSNLSETDLYVLPTTIQGKRCYRVTWGLFDSQEAASEAMSSLPNGIRAGDAAPIAVSRLLR
ncbi:MAG TPA: DUF4388 domain-containing protein [Vicinamibacteria bacterium]|nr:DUF4388 domain-containing protein [Vicinamibacteria bacterium]